MKLSSEQLLNNPSKVLWSRTMIKLMQPGFKCTAIKCISNCQWVPSIAVYRDSVACEKRLLTSASFHPVVSAKGFGVGTGILLLKKQKRKAIFSPA